MTILQHHAVSEMNAMAEEEGETFPKHGSRAYNDIFQSDWKQYLKCARTWDRITLDKEVDRILKRMAGVVADLDDDPSDSEEEQESDIQMDKSELEPYRETLETYIECARWSYMGSLVPNAKTPVDDIPAISLSDFLCYFVAELTKHRAVKKNMFLDYDELNQASVLKPVLIHTLQKTIPKKVYNALVQSRLRDMQKSHASMRSRGHSSSRTSSSRNNVLVHARDQFGPDMLSSRARASRMTVDRLGNTMMSVASSKTVVEEEEAEDEEEEGSSQETTEKETYDKKEKDEKNEQEESNLKKESVLSTAQIPQGDETNLTGEANKLNDDDNESVADVKRVDLSSLSTADTMSRGSRSRSRSKPLENASESYSYPDMGTSVPVYRN